jgi:glycosyltransferase involved in cell wall biosynthesis
MKALTITDIRVTICICTHDRPQGLTQLLVTLQDIDLRGYSPDSIDLIVVDNRPNPETRMICKQAAPRLPIPIQYFEEPEPGVTYARNRAVAIGLERGADFLAFIDDDDHPRPDWLIRLLDRQIVTRADMVFGTWLLDKEMPQWARDSGIFRSPNRSKQHKKSGRYGLPHCASTCNMLASREILERVSAVGPVFAHEFGDSGGEDKDFFLRAQKLGASMASAENSVILRNHEPERYTARGLLRRGFKNGCSQVSMARFHGDRSRRTRLVGGAVTKLIMSLILLPFSILSKQFFMHCLYRIAKASGVLYASSTGRSYKYYSR